MKGDISRNTFDPARHYSSVRLQQGRVQLDGDWNEQVDLTRHRDTTTTADVVGRCGGPLGAAAFGVVLDMADLPADEAARLEEAGYTLEAGDFVLTPGRYYVDGILCEVEHAVPFTAQPDRPP